MTKTELSIQAVTGLIKRSPVTNKSHKYATTTRRVGSAIRTAGLYAEKSYSGQIKVGYWTGGYSHHAKNAQAELSAFAQFAKAEGYQVEMTSGFNMIISKVVA